MDALSIGTSKLGLEVYANRSRTSSFFWRTSECSEDSCEWSDRLNAGLMFELPGIGCGTIVGDFSMSKAVANVEVSKE
jgi:hypothetical protein